MTLSSLRRGKNRSTVDTHVIGFDISFSMDFQKLFSSPNTNMTKCPVCSEAKTANMWCKWKQKVQPAIYFDLWPVYNSPHGHQPLAKEHSPANNLGAIQEHYIISGTVFLSVSWYFLQHSFLDSWTQNPWMMKCLASRCHHGL